MIDPDVLRARGDELCRCGHERAFHDACSKCYCPWYLTPGNAAPLKRWNADRKARRASEPDGDTLPTAKGARR